MKNLKTYKFREDSPDSDREQNFATGGHLFRPLVHIAWEYHLRTGRYLSIWGELGELFVENQYGLKRNKEYAQGFDGRIGNDLIEVKTISPEKKTPLVFAKESSNFNVLVVVKVDRNFKFSSRWIERRELKQKSGGLLSYYWTSTLQET
jgi:hypothetical protein